MLVIAWIMLILSVLGFVSSMSENKKASQMVGMLIGNLPHIISPAMFLYGVNVPVWLLWIGFVLICLQTIALLFQKANNIIITSIVLSVIYFWFYIELLFYK